MNANALKEWLTLADEQGIFDAYRQRPSETGFTPVSFNLPKMKLDWAMDMMSRMGGGGGEDFFSQGHSMPQAPEYVAPQRFAEQAPQQIPMGESMPVRRGVGNSMRRPINNYLAQFLR